MALVRRLLTFLAIGVLLGVVAATWIALQSVPWYNTAGEGTALCNCLETARSSSQAIVRWQLMGGASGGVAFLILGVVLAITGRKNRGRSEPSASAPGTPPTAV